MQTVTLALLVGGAVLVGFRAALWATASPGALSWCVGLVMGVIPATVVFEFLPAIDIASGTDSKVIALGAGFLVAAAVHALVQSGLTGRRSPEEGGTRSFILAVVTDDVVEGLTLGFAGSLSFRLLVFSAVVFLGKNILEGFAAASVLRRQGSTARRTWAGGAAAATAVVVAAAFSTWLAGAGGASEVTRQLMFGGATGMLLYASLMELARNLEWNLGQKIGAAVGFATVAYTANMVGAP